MARRSRCAAAVILAALATGLLPASASAGADTTPPSGTMDYWAFDAATQLAELRFSYADPESGVAQIAVSCDGSGSILVPYAAKLFWPMHDGTGGCTTVYGEHFLRTEVLNSDGLSSTSAFVTVVNDPDLTLQMSAPAVTGQPFTISPVLPSDYAIPVGNGCRWEFRWGDNRSLNLNEYDETFGSLLFDVPATSGVCAPWTFTLPWVPYRQYEATVGIFSQEGGGGFVFGPSVRGRFTASIGTTEQRILASSLPIAQVIPSTYTPIVGSPITYTRYLVGGALACCDPHWTAWQGSGDHPRQWNQTGGSTFTIVTSVPGNVTVEWARQDPTGLLLSAMYDPPVRYRDTAAPVTTAPVEHLGTTSVGPGVPLAVTWTGTDKGWGIASYQLQRSQNGGIWTAISLSSATARSVGFPAVPGSTLRFRVRAKDKAGHLGAWAYGPTFRVVLGSDANAAIHYSGTWSASLEATALGGSLHRTTHPGAAARYTFTGRDIAWLAERGPSHGKAKVYIDGVYITTIDLSAMLDQPRRIVFRRHWSFYGTHTIRIVNLATSGRPLIDLDGVAVLR